MAVCQWTVREALLVLDEAVVLLPQGVVVQCILPHQRLRVVERLLRTEARRIVGTLSIAHTTVTGTMALLVVEEESRFIARPANSLVRYQVKVESKLVVSVVVVVLIGLFY